MQSGNFARGCNFFGVTAFHSHYMLRKPLHRRVHCKEIIFIDHIHIHRSYSYHRSYSHSYIIFIFIDHIQQESAPQGDLPEMRTTALLSRRAMEAAGRKQRKKETF